jgi:hypothetical protein
MALFVTRAKYYLGDKITEDDRVGNVVGAGEKRNVCRCLVGNRKYRHPFRDTNRLKDNIKRDLKAIG